MLNYKELEFKSGLEVHFQLEGNKLFCNCPSLVNDPNEPDITIKRKLRASAGETGKIDIAAEYEMTKDKTIIYEACSTSSCLLEVDECPPYNLNMHALNTAIEIALLLKAKPVEEIRVMRKIVVDGSNPGGYQRSLILATDGFIETSKGKVNIPTIYLEEEAAKKINEDEKTITYRLDRLGVPLMEIDTDSSIKDPEHAKEIASYIGMIVKSTGKAKSGIGSVRQDVNLSIKNLSRIEIKGFQELKSIPKIIEYEVKRLLELIKQKKEIKSEVRKAEPDFTTSFLRPMPGSARMYVETDIPIIPITKQLLSKIKLPELLIEKALKLEKKYKLNPDIAREAIEIKNFEDYIKKYPNIPPSLIAHTLIETPKEIKTRFNLDAEKLTDKDFEFIFSSLNQEKIQKSAIIEILTEILQGKHIDLNKYKPVSEDNVEKDIHELVEQKPDLTIQALMGIVMNKYKGKVDGKKVMEILRKYKH